MGDVAKLAGVSHQTVSRVLNVPGAVRPATRARVEQAIATLGYRRNTAARSLVTRRSETIGVLAFDNTTLYGPASTLAGIESGAREAGFYCSVVSVPVPSPAAVLEAADRLLAQSVEGIIVIAPQQEAAAAVAALPAELAVVVAEGGPVDGLSRAGIDQEQGASELVRHMLSMGHETVHHLAGPSSWAEAVGRTAGWASALGAAGRSAPPVLTGDWTPMSGYRAVLDLDLTDVTALFVANDQMALGALRALHERDVHVPEQVSVAGFDDIPEAAFFSPPLTTVRQDFKQLGLQSVELLLARVREGARVTSVTLAPEVVQRASLSNPPF
jgi:DNA-binding LacI/PurR family transcriptional regulator